MHGGSIRRLICEDEPNAGAGCDCVNEEAFGLDSVWREEEARGKPRGFSTGPSGLGGTRLRA